MNSTFPILSSIAYLAFGGCASQHHPAHNAGAPHKPHTTQQQIAASPPADTDTDTPFGQHPSSSVRSAARFGGGLVGVVVGIPASIALIPVTLPLAAVTKQKWTGLYPFGASYYAGGALFGGVVTPFAFSSSATPTPTKSKRKRTVSIRQSNNPL
jgi:hypothetical protein